jgi:hypothetical protein
MKIKQNKKCNDFWKHETRMATFLNQNKRFDWYN